MSRLSLRMRMALVFGLLIIGVAIFMIQFFPARMAEQAQASTELRGRTVTKVMASALAPALEFDDAENAARILSWLGSTPDAKFAVVITDGGTRFAAWSPERIPATLPRGESTVRGNMLITSAPIVGRGDGRGTLYIGQSLERLAADREAAEQTVLTASAMVLLIGLLACIVIATTLVRPLERLTMIAHDIARGSKPPKINLVTGGVEVVQMTSALGTMLDRLNAANSQLVQASRHAGMAEVATGVLHNVGNILTSVNVGIATVSERVDGLPGERVQRVATLLGSAPAIEPDKLAAAVTYLTAIGDHLQHERQALLADLVTLGAHVEHINRVISMQNGYACTGGIEEQVEVGKLVEEAVALGCPDAARHDIAIERCVADSVVVIDRHRILQILVNLIANARDSVSAHRGERRISVGAQVDDSWFELRVNDTGGGIAPASLVRIFSAGFTTKPRGHGYGLHSSALAAEQLGGTLRCHSDGPGKGASFVLRVPIKRGTS